MAVETRTGWSPGWERLPSELTGALGDSVTVLPILLALGALTPVPVGVALALFAGFQVVWGVRYRLPISVEPMKALAALAIAGTLTLGEFAAAGLLAGVALLALGATGALGRVERFVGEPVVRGVQLGVGLLLARTGLELAVTAPAVATAGVAVAGVAVLAGRPRSSVLLVTAAGVAWAVAATGLPALSLPVPAVPPLDLSRATLDATAGQLAMTVGNAAIATSLLVAHLYDAEVSADDLATSMGAMTLVAVPAGGVPMCHGSGGLAGKYAFGARTYVSNLLLGALYLLAALVAGSGLLAAFPTPLLGVLLLAVAAQLARTAMDTDGRPIALGVGAASLAVGIGGALVAGVVAHLALDRIRAW